jgi:hypothetical protein
MDSKRVNVDSELKLSHCVEKRCAGATHSAKDDESGDKNFKVSAHPGRIEEMKAKTQKGAETKR